MIAADPASNSAAAALALAHARTDDTAAHNAGNYTRGTHQ
jgi:hypothetical protein